MTGRYIEKTVALIMLAWVLVAPTPAAAQGNGRGNAHGHNKRPSASAPSAPSSSTSPSPANGGGSVEFPADIQPDGAGVRNFGSWLDDASVMTPGTAFTSFAVGYWRMPGFTEFDVPAMDLGIGLSRRIHVGASLPVYHAGEPGGPVARGLGDLLISTKIQLRDPASASRRLGFALVPVVEVRSSTAPETSRFSWGLPATVELQRDGWRAYGSAGYFSRGALFGSGALEVGVGRRTWLTATISQSRSVTRDDLSEALGLSKMRRDISGGATVLISDRIAAFGSVGRTISMPDANSTTISITGGLSVNFQAW